MEIGIKTNFQHFGILIIIYYCRERNNSSPNNRFYIIVYIVSWNHELPKVTLKAQNKSDYELPSGLYGFSDVSIHIWPFEHIQFFAWLSLIPRQ